MKCLNLGCGTDYRISDENDEWINLDYKESWDPVRKNGIDVNYNLESKPLRFPFKDGEFDRIICYHVIEHINTDMVKLFWEIHRILKVGGTFEIRTPHFSSWNASGMYHIRSYNIKDFLLKYNFPDSFPKFEIEKAELHYRMKEYMDKSKLRILYSFFDLLANLNVLFCERFWCYYVGGFEEMEMVYTK
jgi:SAM-dependent methyltransferase